ncbi:MAG: gliding motility-associated C-terminal domain-containing protein [Bacteroidales bacterium]|nr:MAG: gliding motility-associated C-terminal domain-containing protein [Bacteroidales bacterium]
MKRAILIPVLFTICIPLFTQTIGGVVNYYLEVDSVFNDTIRVTEDPSVNFTEGDFVLLIQMTGASFLEHPLHPRWPGLGLDQPKNCGKYEFLQVEDVITPENYLVFTSYLLNDYDNDEKVQLVKVMTGDKLTVASGVTADSWDGSKGGIVALMAYDELVLNANINVSSKGFRGATPDSNYTGGCRYGIAPTYDTCFFDASQVNRAGNKGEGVLSINYPLTKGAGYALNGGGGGNGLYSGGAGGGNYGSGGEGGHQIETCGVIPHLVNAQGGFGAETEFYEKDKIIFGGGGGAGTMNSDSGRFASRGGNGGGMIFILANTLSGNGYSIVASGQNVASTVNASGGGGGGGGVILLDVPNNNGDLSYYVSGGDGGNTGANCTGSGGGGGGGVILHSGASLPAITIDTSFGTAGNVDCVLNGGSNGSRGATIPDLVLPLNGFLFNTIYGIDTICQGQVPNTITGSQPKGGNGSYSYEWLQSTDQTSWSTADGTYDMLLLTPDPLDTTTYFRRVVSSINRINDSTIVDSSKIIEIFVYQLIENNTLYVTDTICKNVIPAQLTGGILSGGSSMYNYSWERSENMVSWEEVSDSEAFNEGSLSETRYYRRIVTSAVVCTDTSEIDTIAVLELITNNDFITPDTTICENDDAGTLTARIPSNGDGTYSYEWQKSENSGQTWDTLPYTDPVISPGQLTITTLFRRIVFSGNDDACTDTSDNKEVLVEPLISSNNISTDSVKYCAGDIPNTINGSSPSGGSGSYTYKWLGMTASVWTEITGETGINYPPSTIFETTTSITRVVLSGEYDACKDTASPVAIEIVPYIINNLDIDEQTICENNTPDQFTVNPATGGSGSYIYEWLLQEEGSATWDAAPGINNNVSYTAGPLSETTSYVRRVDSDICSDISDTALVTVYKFIKDNIIIGDAVQYVCFNASKLLNGSEPSDGSGFYGYEWETSDDLISWAPATGVIPNDQQSFQTSALANSAYFRRIVFSSEANRECIDTTSHVEVLINELPTADIISSQDTVCAGNSIYVKFNVDGVHGPWDVTIGTSFEDTTKLDVTSNFDSIPIVLSSSGTIKLISVEDDSTCLADTTLSSGIVNAEIYVNPVAYAGEDVEVCGLVSPLNAERSIGSSIGLWETDNATFNQPGNPNTAITADDYGTYILTWTETYWQCFDSDDMQIIFYEQPVTAEAGDNQILEFIFVTELNALAPTIGYGTWSVSSGGGVFDNPTLPNTTVRDLDYENVLKWTVQNGVCATVSDSININVNPLTVPQGFSPNGDGINDEFRLVIENAESVEILIFDRQGHIVFETDNYQDGNFWDGKNQNDKDLPEGTYFYILKAKVVNKDEVMIKSFIELIR